VLGGNFRSSGKWPTKVEPWIAARSSTSRLAILAPTGCWLEDDLDAREQAGTATRRLWSRLSWPRANKSVPAEEPEVLDVLRECDSQWLTTSPVVDMPSMLHSCCMEYPSLLVSAWNDSETFCNTRDKKMRSGMS
jgi:hypothetical protein